MSTCAWARTRIEERGREAEGGHDEEQPGILFGPSHACLPLCSSPQPFPPFPHQAFQGDNYWPSNTNTVVDFSRGEFDHQQAGLFLDTTMLRPLSLCDDPKVESWTYSGCYAREYFWKKNTLIRDFETRNTCCFFYKIKLPRAF